MQEVYDEISIRLQDKNITYEATIFKDWELINVNKFLLFNLFFNLINNAIKYNRKNGLINVSTANENGTLSISVTDSGIGIGPEELPYVFNRFKKFRQSLQQDSFGLGLPIVKTIATFHDIVIEVISEKGTGTTFKLIFPPGLVKVG